jgi:Flp pilus assembly pilin Flp
MRTLRGSGSSRSAVGLTEYVIIVVLVAIAVIGAVMAYRDAVDNRYADSTAHIHGLPAGGTAAGGGKTP